MESSISEMLTKECRSEVGSHRNYTVLMSILGLSLSSDMDLGMSLARPVLLKPLILDIKIKESLRDSAKHRDRARTRAHHDLRRVLQ